MRLGSHCKYFESENKRTAHPFKEVWGHCLWKMAGEAALGVEVMKELGSTPFSSSANVIEGRAVGADICADHTSSVFNSATQARRALLDASYGSDAALDLLIITANSMFPVLCDDGPCKTSDDYNNIRIRKDGFLVNVNGMPGVWTGAENKGAALYKVASVRVSERGTSRTTSAASPSLHTGPPASPRARPWPTRRPGA